MLKKAALISLALGIIPLVASAGQANPNVVYILADDMGIGDLGCYNPESKIPTPHMDALAAIGMRFTDAHSGSAVCTPTRYGLLTGRYCWRTRLKSGVTWGASPCLIPPDRMTVASLLKKHGYNTACVGKWHVGLDWATKEPGVTLTDNWQKDVPKIDFSKPIRLGPPQLGFDYFFGIPASLDMPPYVYVQNDRVTAAPTGMVEGKSGKPYIREGIAAPGFNERDVLPEMTRRALAWLDKQSADTPFFLYFPLPAPHTPVVPIEKFRGKSKAGEYGDFVVQCDWVVGQVIETLKQRGVANNTLLIVTSDNGSSPHGFPIKEEIQYQHATSHIYKGRKSHTYEGGHRVAFIASWPARMKAGSVCDEPICHTDLLATCAEIVGEKLPDGAGEDSVSILPLLEGRKLDGPLREAVVHHSLNGTFCIRQGEWKLIHGPGHGGFTSIKEPFSKDSIQLYHVAGDVRETKNVAEEHPEVVNRLRKLLASYIERGRSTPGHPQSNDGPAYWKQLEGIVARPAAVPNKK